MSACSQCEVNGAEIKSPCLQREAQARAFYFLHVKNRNYLAALGSATTSTSEVTLRARAKF